MTKNDSIMKDIIITSKDQLQNLLEQTVRKVLKEGSKPTPLPTRTSPEEDILTIQQAMPILNLAKATIYTLTSKGKVPHFKKGKKLYFKRSELLRWIEDGKRKSKKEIEQEADDYLSKKEKR